MATEIKLPELGENIASGTVTSILVKVGDTVNIEQNVLELETDKAVLEVPSPAQGIVQEILINEGDDVAVGQAVFKFDAVGAAPQTSQETSHASQEKTASTTTEAPKQEVPAAAPAKQEAPTPTPETNNQQPTTNTIAPPAKDVAAAPSVRRFAREIGIDVTQVPGSGSGGRISKDDVKAYSKQLNEGHASGSGGSAGIPGLVTETLPDFSKWGNVTREKMSKIRQKTAEHLHYAWVSIPHVTQYAKADITDLEKLRKKASTPDRKLTVTPFLLKVIASALKKFPQFNSSIDMNTKEVIYKNYINIGVAVDTDRGLLVPVLHDVDKKNINELTDELNELAQKARDKKLTLDDMQGGTFTLTNLGGIGGTSFTPIVNSPEVAILGVSRGGFEQVYSDGQFVPRFNLPLSLSYDHRIIDGADGARFIRWICEAIEQPFLMNLEN